MENTNQIAEQTAQVITPEGLLNHWQGHRNITRRVIEAFPEEHLFSYSIGGMRSFGSMAIEIMDLSANGIIGIVTGNWASVPELSHRSGSSSIKTKNDLLNFWDKVTEDLKNYWPQIQPQQFQEVILAFGQYEGDVTGTIQYIIDNEIHHRAQGFVYLRGLGIEPPAFWDRN
ncbi:Uncharacterized damage-inducible protein DinB (forms a four-helix bundle) [Pseudarcicella hirudinis]|uniref:Uncharacterized damage-inducible protein DinB (Forms a four-helix bundle) n=1 Tax=Pseudarcicella hirudinis TaxID=1079859 RepID=A0A1I5UR65_9BACT|nr:DinB family protein [Pseudarcicella hirudinis]SFP97761.1 Uncharacterized damage-inducible protein DinB (forms a four-helix bundle) [Pseudarcicella hirudinis]